MVLLAGCSTAPSKKTSGVNYQRNAYIPNKYSHEEVPIKSGSVMVASWYGPDFHGKPTASGEIYDMNAMTAAHKTLPFGTILQVTNPKNGASAKVVVNDRGPFITGRDLDLSYSAAKAIGVYGPGTMTVEIDYLGRDMRYVKYIKVSDTIASSASPSGYTIQIGAFQEQQNALRLKSSLEFEYKGVYIKQISSNGKTIYRVRVGKYKDKTKAIEYAKGLAEVGYDTLVTASD
ncbi:MAG: septal ring lytic transglycosylase RlpA family protein [Nitrospirae bacterium]|nr:septal ring lytic transglycosylase RlpA family protein [Nitrospirota bacterium]